MAKRNGVKISCNLLVQSDIYIYMSYWEFFLFSKTFKFYNNVHHVREYAQFQDTYSRLGHRSVLFSRSIGELTSWWAKQVLKSSLKH